MKEIIGGRKLSPIFLCVCIHNISKGIKMDILSFINKTHPLKFMFAGLFLMSLVTNFSQFKHTKKLQQQLEEAKQPIIIVLPESQEVPKKQREQPDLYERIFTRII